MGKAFKKFMKAYAFGVTGGAFGEPYNTNSTSSPTYEFSRLGTQSNNTLPIPIVYGEVKLAGNIIWQSGANTSRMQRLIAIADGEIESISDIKLNDIAISSLSGCSYTAYTGTSTQTIDSRVTGTTQEIKAELVGGLRNLAYLAITATASSQLSGNFNTTTMVKGSKVKIYSNTTTHTTTYSNNPAWCVLDFLTRYNGCGISIDEIDIQSFIDAAEYCEQQVSGQPRFTLNFVLDEKKSRLNWLDEMLLCCRGYLVNQNGKLSIKIEQAENVMQVFTPDNILVSSEKFWTISREQKADVFKIQYIDPTNEYARVYAVAEATTFEADPPIVQEIQAYGVTNFNQASRLAWFYLNQAKTCNKFISFQTSQEGLDRTVGDVIEITSTFLGYINKKMRIINISEAQDGKIEIVCKEYNASLYNDQIGSARPVINYTNLTNVFETPPTPQNLALNEVGWLTKEGVHISTIDITWDSLDYKFLSHYLISYSEDNGATWIYSGISYDNNHTISNIKTGSTYEIAIQSVNYNSVMSDKTVKSITITGKDNPPSSVPKLTVIQSGDYLKAFITPPSDPDIKCYELRKGNYWQTSELVTRFIDNTTSFRATEEGSQAYLVKAVDYFGNYSESATESVVDVGALTPKNIVLQRIEDMSLWINDSNSFLDTDNKFKLGTDTTTSTLHPESLIILPTIDLGEGFADKSKPKETFIDIDVQYNKSVNTLIDIEFRTGYENCIGWDNLVFDQDDWEEENVVGWDALEWDKDQWDKVIYDINWGDWVSFKDVQQLTGRFIQTRLSLKSLDNTTNVDIEGVTITADVPDIEEVIKNINIPAEKTTINLSKVFSTVSNIVLYTSDNTGTAVFWRISNASQSQFDLELLDINNEVIEGKLIKAVVTGY